MASDAHPPGSELWALTLALLRFGADTLAARLLKALWSRPFEDLTEELLAALPIAPGDRARCLQAASRWAVRAQRDAAAAGLQALPWFHAEYPPLLREIADPPIVLWCAGDPSVLSRPAVAVVGSRRAAPTGLRVARQIAAGLAETGIVVVSGLAHGIDGAAHVGALEAGGTTVGVLGCGADRIYPADHAALAARMRASGAIVSEFPPRTCPLPHHFPRRNRIISGLSRAVVVIEASQRSGSLITARLALEQGREVMAVPGTLASGQYAGCHALIKDGAALVETVNDVLDAAGWPARRDGRAVRGANCCLLNRLESTMAVGEPYTVDELAALSGLSGAELLAELGALEVAGVVGRIPGAGFVRFDKSAIGGGNG